MKYDLSIRKFTYFVETDVSFKSSEAFKRYLDEAEELYRNTSSLGQIDDEVRSEISGSDETTSSSTEKGTVLWMGINQN